MGFTMCIVRGPAHSPAVDIIPCLRCNILCMLLGAGSSDLMSGRAGICAMQKRKGGH